MALDGSLNGSSSNYKIVFKGGGKIVLSKSGNDKPDIVVEDAALICGGKKVFNYNDRCSFDLNGGVLDINGNETFLRNFGGTGGVVTNSRPEVCPTLVFRLQSGSGEMGEREFSGSLNGNFNVRMYDSGYLRLSGTNSYGGWTSKEGSGKLYVDGYAACSNFDFKSGFLSGTGVLDCALAAGDGGSSADAVLASEIPGEKFTVTGSLTLKADCSVQISIDTSVSCGYGKILCGGLSLGDGESKLVLNVSGDSPPDRGEKMILIENTSAEKTSGWFEGLPEGAVLDINGAEAVISYRAGEGRNDVQLYVPFPATLLFVR